MAEISLGDVDIEAVLLRLTRHAQGLFGAVRSLGVEPVNEPAEVRNSVELKVV